MLSSQCRCVFHVLALLLILVPVARSTTIGFEGVAPPGGQVTGNGYTEAGYTFTGQSTIFDSGFGGSVNTNGTDILAWCASDCGPNSITLTGSGAFDLLSIDVATMTSRFTTGMSVDLTGFFSGGGSIFTSLPVTTTWTTHTIAGFFNLASLQIVAIDPTEGGLLYDSAIDNLNVTAAVPEPSAFLLLGTGLLGLAGYRRFRRERPVTRTSGLGS